ncbi:energy transducer TonB [Sphingomonas sp.]|jgi:TonB family protein|uniref:energy transducer TonB n=1 Tax=Sphingomonas sp. TaxID=28214 RepID=UPI00261041B9|nr:energy transducer TonB [Sphingomonas sp.]MDF2495081.1 energy transducer TonB [Sphingomonas sp.]
MAARSKEIGAILLAIAAMTLTASPALARDWPTTAGWEILEGGDYCAISSEFQGKGETELTVAKRLDGDVVLIVTNYGWSAKKDASYELTFHVDGKEYGGGKAIGIGESYGRKGFATKFSADFASSLSAGSGLKIYMGDTLVDSLNLSGSRAAFGTVDRCLAAKRAIAAAAERERQRFAHIPDDPFTGASAGPTPPRGNPADWITQDDYPPSAIRAEEEGTTSIAFTVNSEGRVEDCRVTASSGSPALDQATCRTLTRRGRYTPANDAAGKPTSAAGTHTFTWRLPN